MSATPRTDAVRARAYLQWNEKGLDDALHECGKLERELTEATKMLCNETTRANANAALVAEARSLCRDLYAYALEVRTSRCSYPLRPLDYFGKLRTRLRAMECE